MGTLTLKNTWKNLTLVAAGALMATMIAVPLAGVASADDANGDEPYIGPAGPTTYTIKTTKGLTSTFELVERDGQKMLVLMSEDSRFVNIPPADDDE